jgi:hypothetical protein
MGWERRGDREYYYRKRRIGGRVVSRYLGLTEFAHEYDAFVSDEKARRDLDRHDREYQAAVDRELDRFGAFTRMLATAVLIDAGYHLHKGQWRRRRRTQPARIQESEVEQDASTDGRRHSEKRAK